MLPWAGYRRVSRVGDRAERLISPDLQADRIRSYAASRGLSVEMLEPELDVSGGKVERPILSEVIAGIEGGAYAGIIVAQLDRLSRMNIEDALKTIRRIESAGGQVIAVAENFDAGTPAGKMGRTVVLAMGEMQLDGYKAQFRAAKRSAVERGIWPVPKAPIGYTVKHRKYGGDGRLKVDPAKAPLVVRAFELRAGGASWTPIVDELQMGSTSVKKVVGNRVYLGEIILGDLRNPDAHEAIVSRELFEAAQLGHPRPPRGTSGPALLAGLLRCEGCGYVMTVDRSPKVKAYRCFARKAAGKCPAPAIISIARVEPFVEQLVLSHIDDLAYSATDRTARLDAAVAALEAAEAELGAYQEMTRVSDVGPEAFLAGMHPRVEAVEQARADVVSARGQQSLAHAGKLRELWDGLDVAERRHVLRSALSVGWVRKGRGPARERVRLVGFGHPVVRPGDGDLPGEIRPAGTENVAEARGGAGA